MREPDTTAHDLDELAGRIDGLVDDFARAAMAGGRSGDGLGAVGVLLGAVDRIHAVIVGVVQDAEHAAVVADRGLTRESWLRAVAGRTGPDAGMLLAAAERLADMPATSAWFAQGVLSWGAVRAIVASTRHLTAAQRGWVDQTLHADRDNLLRADQDQLVAAADGLAAEARRDLVEAGERSQLARRWLTIQPRLDGTADICGSLDVETAAAALAAFDTYRCPDSDASAGDGDGADSDGGPDTGGDGDRGGEAGVASAGDRVRTGWRRANVDIFGDLCRQRVTRTGASTAIDAGAAAGGGPADATSAADVGVTAGATHRSTGAADQASSNDQGTGSRAAEDQRVGVSGGAGSSCGCGSVWSAARPSFLVVADLAALSRDGDGVGSGTARLHWATGRGAPVEITPAAARRLACDATLRAVITDGPQVLGVTAAHPKVSASLRAALAVRDGGCRFPACGRPVDHCDAHHIVSVLDDGPTRLRNLALVCRDHHHAIHDSGWHVRSHPDATMTFSRRGVTLMSLPRASQHPPRATSPPPGRPPRRPSRDGPSPEPDHVGAEPDRPAGEPSQVSTDTDRHLLPF